MEAFEYISLTANILTALAIIFHCLNYWRKNSKCQLKEQQVAPLAQDAQDAEQEEKDIPCQATVI